jgi:glycosyltransferase involved in cell wall biosynthesis
MHDVISAVQSNTLAAAPIVVAMAAPGDTIEPAWPVKYVIRQDRIQDYVRVALALRTDGIDLVSIQHEHGIYGGEAGVMLCRFLDALGGSIPVVSTLHTVLPRPTNAVRRAVTALAAQSDRVVVLNNRAIPLLAKAYGIGTDHVVAIPHGTPRFDHSRRPIIRACLGLEGQTVASTFGLLSPGKGLEHMIVAVAHNAADHQDLHYYILGATHPGILRETGESYREGLRQRASELGVSDRVHFVNRYLALDEVTDWLLATDIFVAPYLNADQIVSGTLSYAVAAGKVVLSTPFLHALDLLGGGVGMLTPFEDPEAMGASIDTLLSNPDRRALMSAKAKAVGSESAWPRVAQRYVRVFADAMAIKMAAAAEPAPVRTGVGIGQIGKPRGRRRHARRY